MITRIKFQAYIPKSLGKPLYDYFKNDPDLTFLRDRNDFERRLKSFDGKGYYWIPEPGNSINHYFCSTDDIDYPLIRPFGHSVRLGFELEIDIQKIGEHYPKNPSDVLKHNKFCNGDDLNQHSGFSHRVQVFFQEVAGYYIGHIKEFQPKKSVEKPLICTVKTMRPYFSTEFDTAEINVIASAGYPYGIEVLTPNIDFNLYFKIQRTNVGGYVSCSGWHNDFPAYEMIVDNTRIYQHIPKATGPNLLNLGMKMTHFHCSKNV